VYCIGRESGEWLWPEARTSTASLLRVARWAEARPRSAKVVTAVEVKNGKGTVPEKIGVCPEQLRGFENIPNSWSAEAIPVRNAMLPQRPVFTEMAGRGTPSFVPQRLHWVDAHGVVGWDVAGDEGGQDEQRGDRRESEGVVRGDAD
jgi:hypothetical protein